MYDKQLWKKGDKVSSSKLNHIEDGIFQNYCDNNILLVHITPGENDIIADKTFQEIKEACLNGKQVYAFFSGRVYDLLYDIDYSYAISFSFFGYPSGQSDPDFYNPECNVITFYQDGHIVETSDRR